MQKQSLDRELGMQLGEVAGAAEEQDFSLCWMRGQSWAAQEEEQSKPMVAGTSAGTCQHREQSQQK